MTWEQRFQKSCRDWQAKLGLTDWTVRYKSGKEHQHHEADVSYSCESRHATITSYKTSDTLDPQRVAIHEMLHLLFADMLSIAAQRGGDHPDIEKEEHRAIERLLNALDGRP